MKKTIVFGVLLALAPLSSFASGVTCKNLGDQFVLCQFSFSDKPEVRKKEILYFQCTVEAEKKGDPVPESDIEMANHNIKSGGFTPGGHFKGTTAIMNTFSFASKFDRDALFHTVTIGVESSPVKISCTGSDKPDRQTYPGDFN